MLKIGGGETAKRDDMWLPSDSGGGDWETMDDGGGTEDELKRVEDELERMVEDELDRA